VIDIIEVDMNLIRTMVINGKRIDKRKLDEYRKITVEKGIIPSAEGSARVRLGDTEIVAGVKISLGEPFPDRPEDGVLMVNAELVPLAAADFESGPPGKDAIELARVVDRTIRESKAVDLSKLCITKKEKVWMVSIDIDVMDYDGNFIDAACLASVAALHNAKMPKLDEEGKIIYGELTDEKLPVNGMPVATTFVKINGKILADPTFSELEAMDARLTVGTVDKDGIYVSAMQKGGSVGLTMEEMESILGMAETKGEELRKLIKD
jgi:exosome complex component RRP42